MNQDHTFRLALIALAFMVLPVLAYHRVRSQATGERLDRWQEGVFILFTLRLVGAAMWFGLLAYMIDPGWMAWSSVSLPEWLRWLGVVFGVIGGSLLMWTLPNLGKNLTDTVVTRRAHTLVSSGPYRWVRHPFYDAVALYLAANALAAANWFLLLTGVVGVALLVIRTRTEEEKLILRFGDAYRAYVGRTGRFLPRIRMTLLLMVLLAGAIPGQVAAQPQNCRGTQTYYEIVFDQNGQPAKNVRRVISDPGPVDAADFFMLSPGRTVNAELTTPVDHTRGRCRSAATRWRRCVAVVEASDVQSTEGDYRAALRAASATVGAAARSVRRRSPAAETRTLRRTRSGRGDGARTAASGDGGRAVYAEGLMTALFL